jgi:lipocalin
MTTDINGTGTIQDPAKPNYLTVKLGIKIFGYVLFQTAGDYTVWQTDYNNYAVVYSCKEVIPSWLFGGLRADTVWILTRTKNLTGIALSDLYSTLTTGGVDTSAFYQTPQTCNN